SSQRVYAAVAYLVCRPLKKQPFSNLIFAKAKLAVMKKTSIPRLELLGSVLAAKLVRFLRKQLKITLSSVQILSDSQIALYWIHSNKQLKTFVNNRVKYIKEVTQELSDANIPYKFHYVNTDSNPADCATRGLSASELSSHMWWHGPSFILNQPTKWPNTDMDFSAKTIPPKEAQEEFKSVINTSIDTYKSFIPFIKTSSYEKLVRITSYVLKYISILWRKGRKGESTEENSHRIIILIRNSNFRETSKYREEVLQLQGRIVQRLQVSMCDDGIYRGDLRMANAEILDTAKNPILLLPNHQLTRLIVTDFHQKLFHAGVSHLISELRNHYLIPRVRRVVNAVVRRCVVCRRHQGRSFSYPRIPDLPSQRRPHLTQGQLLRLPRTQRKIRLYYGQSTSLTPISHLPTQEHSNSSDRSIISNSHEEIINSYVLLQDTLDTFWNHWQKEYLQNLAERNQKRSTLRQGAKYMPKVGDVVLIKTENTQRSQWPLGLIIQINESVDGSVRSVRIKTGNNKVLDRSVNQLIPL
ncbi:hypothetical protein OSTOST_08539, partial [Ostertagia ostertagi]